MKKILFILAFALPFLAMAQPAPPDPCEQSKHIIATPNWTDTAWYAGEGLPQFADPAPAQDIYDTFGSRFDPPPTYVLIIGSITCNQFRNQVGLWNLSPIPVRACYTLEAHPALPDSAPYVSAPWPKDPPTRQHRTYQDRIDAATAFISLLNPNFPVYLDTPNNDVWKWGGSYPVAWYIIDDGMVCDAGAFSLPDLTGPLPCQMLGTHEAADQPHHLEPNSYYKKTRAGDYFRL